LVKNNYNSLHRIFVTVGLLRLQKTEKIGLQSLLEVSDLWGKDFGSGHVGFQLAPRINAIGRLGDPTDGLRMIISDDYVFARNIAKKLDLENKKRKSIEKDILNEAKQMVLNDSSYQENKVLVLYQALWHQGVIGIVASRIVEHFHKPCLMISVLPTPFVNSR
jgi:single-stranded-DNA-specific exonuclease